MKDNKAPTASHILSYIGLYDHLLIQSFLQLLSAHLRTEEISFLLQGYSDQSLI